MLANERTFSRTRLSLTAVSEEIRKPKYRIAIEIRTAAQRSQKSPDNANAAVVAAIASNAASKKNPNF